MPVKKKASKKAKKVSTKKTSKKSTTKRSTWKSRQLVDEVLIKVNPQVQKRVDQLIATLNDTKEARMGDLKWLAGQILVRSKEISKQLKNVKSRSTRKKSK